MKKEFKAILAQGHAKTRYKIAKMPGNTQTEKTINFLFKTMIPKKGNVKQLNDALLELSVHLAKMLLKPIYSLEGDKLLKAKMNFLKFYPKVSLTKMLLEQQRISKNITKSDISDLLKKTKIELLDEYYTGIFG